MIFDKKEQKYIDVTTHPYFKDYETAITLNGLILMLQYGSVICVADCSRFQPDPIEIYNKKTDKVVDTATDEYFKKYEVAASEDVILLIQYGSVICSASSEVYGIRNKTSQTFSNEGLLASEQEVYQYIVSYIEKHKYAPTYEEIICNSKVRSKSTISLYIKKMLDLGILESDAAPGSARALRLPNPA